MTFDPKIYALRVHICLVCFANILSLLYWLFYRRIWIYSCLGVMNSTAIVSFCTHLTFDLIPRLRHISRLGIHPYGCWHMDQQGPQLAWMPHSTQFCHPKKFFMEWNHFQLLEHFCVSTEPRQANLCLRAFRHEKFYLRMPSHSEGPGIWLSV